MGLRRCRARRAAPARSSARSSTVAGVGDRPRSRRGRACRSGGSGSARRRRRPGRPTSCSVAPIEWAKAITGASAGPGQLVVEVHAIGADVRHAQLFLAFFSRRRTASASAIARSTTAAAASIAGVMSRAACNLGANPLWRGHLLADDVGEAPAGGRGRGSRRPRPARAPAAARRPRRSTDATASAKSRPRVASRFSSMRSWCTTSPFGKRPRLAERAGGEAEELGEGVPLGMPQRPPAAGTRPPWHRAA